MRLQSEQFPGVIFLIGIALLWATGWWFPGILFVLGATAMTSSLRTDHRWYRATGAIWLFGLGTIFWLDLPWFAILVLIALTMVLCNNDDDLKSKIKNDYKSKRDDYV